MEERGTEKGGGNDERMRERRKEETGEWKGRRTKREGRFLLLLALGYCQSQ